MSSSLAKGTLGLASVGLVLPPPPSTDPSQPLFHFVSPPCWALCRLTLVVIIMGKGKSKVRSVLMLEDSIWKQLRAAPLT